MNEEERIYFSCERDKLNVHVAICVTDIPLRLTNSWWR